MAKSDLLLSLVRAGATGDKNMLRTTVEAMMADERAKNHHILADRLSRALQSVPVATTTTSTNLHHTPNQSSGRDIVLEIVPQVQLDDLVLPLPALAEGRQLIEEQLRADVLRAHSFEPRNRVLLSGPPGNGKTSFAEAIAEGLALPFLVVRYDALVGSFLGETNSRLRALFDYVRTQRCVLFFDEFDSIGKERGDTHETGEIKRVVSFLLMQIDQLPSYVVTIAATNHAELLDRAVWRRFQVRVSLPAPRPGEVASFVAKLIATWPTPPMLKPAEIASRLNVASYAEALDFCQNVRRRQILSLGNVDIDSALETELNLWIKRVNPEPNYGVRSE